MAEVTCDSITVNNEGPWDLPITWGWYKLSEVAPADSQTVLPSEHPAKTFNYLGLENVGKGQWTGIRYSVLPGNEIKSTCISFNETHVLYAKLRPYLNKVYVPQEKGIGSTEWVPLKPHPTRINREYLAWFLRSPRFVSYAKNNMGGARMPRIRMMALWEALVPIPYPNDPTLSLKLQTRIVARIKELLADVSECRMLLARMQQNVEKVMEAALREVFDPAVITAKGWSVKEIKKLCKTKSGGTPSRRHPEYFSGTIPWVKSGELNDEFIKETEELITEEALNDSSARLFPKGTLLMAMYGATVGKLGFLGMDAATNQAICALFPFEGIEHKVDKEYLFWFLRYKRKALIEQSFGGAQPNISQTVIRSISVPIPQRYEEQLRLAAHFQLLQQELTEMQKTISRDLALIDRTEQAILEQAFRGEL